MSEPTDREFDTMQSVHRAVGMAVSAVVAEKGDLPLVAVIGSISIYVAEIVMSQPEDMRKKVLDFVQNSIAGAVAIATRTTDIANAADPAHNG